MNEKTQSISTSMKTRTWPTWLVLATVLAVLDLLIKYIVETCMPYSTVEPVTAFFNLVHVWNTGAAFSFLANAGGWQRYFLIAIALGVSLVLIVMLIRGRLTTVESLGYSLVLGGALGNAIDRLARGYVVDYLDFYWRTWHWPAFNLADSVICVGAGILVFAISKRS